ncbi:prophenoloxidase activating factor serine proteinase [Penaeus vannamei]|uniref:Prophenoloxidase activating factor serine proteinase n=1 Tax=Penaeus vannamei TaxID=6689 RepID=A0A3R7PDL9_PENVA|nr:prophenoloxidase activating factor serine proteinase [Penaeus vannamei]
MLALESYVFHEGYTENYFNLDIALLRLEEALDLTSHPEVRPVCLPSDPTKVYEGQTGKVVGWGDTTNGDKKYPDIVREVDLPIVECGRKEIAGVLITPFMLCAGFKKGGKDSCSGDSGPSDGGRRREVHLGGDRLFRRGVRQTECSRRLHASLSFGMD